MNTRTIALAAMLGFAAGYALGGPAATTQIVSQHELARGFEGETGTLYMTPSTNGVAPHAYLSAAVPGMGMVPVYDKHALHRNDSVIVSEGDDYVITADEGVYRRDDGIWVMFAMQDPPPGLTKHLYIHPRGDWNITRILWTSESVIPEGGQFPLNTGVVDVQYVDGAVVVTVTVREASELPACCGFALKTAYGSKTTKEFFVEDLTVNDYWFFDSLCSTNPAGDRMGADFTSLGQLRPWVNKRLYRHRGDDWSLYPASNTVDLANNELRFNYTYQMGTSTNGWEMRAGGEPVLVVTPGAGDTFRIARQEFDLTSETCTVVLEGCVGLDDIRLQTCTDIVEQAWADVPGITYEASAGGTVKCRFPRSQYSRGFYRGLATPTSGGEVASTRMVAFAFPVSFPSDEDVYIGDETLRQYVERKIQEAQ